MTQTTTATPRTPGPWEASKPGDYSSPGIRIIGYAYRPICTLAVRKGESEGNAALIAAAPDLLQALRLLYDETADYIRINHLGDVHHNRSMILAREALAKAEGIA